MLDRERVRKAFVSPAEFTTSPLYRSLSRTVAASDQLLDLAGQGRPGQYPTFLFFGAVHRLLLRGTDHPLGGYYPSVVGAAALAFVIALYLLLDGVALIGLAWDQRKRMGRRWPWLMLSGVLDLLLAGLIAALGPLSDAVLLGFIIALDLIVAGIALTGMGLAARRPA